MISDTIYGYSSRILVVDGHRLPYAVNQTITYGSEGRRRMPYLVQRLRADDVSAQRSVADDALHYNLTTSISKGKRRLLTMISDVV